MCTYPGVLTYLWPPLRMEAGETQHHPSVVCLLWWGRAASLGVFLLWNWRSPCFRCLLLWPAFLGTEDVFDVQADLVFLHFALFRFVVIVHLLSRVQLHGLQHARLPCPSLPPGACSNSCPLSQWFYPTISSSVIPFFCLQSFPVLGSFPVTQLLAGGGQSIGASASASGLTMNIQAWFPLGLTGLISLLSKGLSRVFFSTTVWKHQFFSTQPCSWPKSHICTWLLEKTIVKGL